MTRPVVHLLCAGAAQGLVKAIQADWEKRFGATLVARFGAVGMLRDSLRAGDACDLMVTTAAMAAALAADGVLQAASIAPLGVVRTGIAVRRGDPVPELGTAAALVQALRQASVIHFPDPERATAGIHFAKVLRQLGVMDELAGRLVSWPNGATSMRELADSGSPAPLGCTQVSEIPYTEGVVLAAPLIDPFGLSTQYSAALAQQSPQPGLAAHLLRTLVGPETQALRAAGGIDS